jgi:hypothetical protein
MKKISPYLFLLFATQSIAQIEFTTHSVINSHINAPYSVYSADLDNDGDMDIVSGSANDNKVAWYANNGNNTFSAQKIITTNAINLRDVYIADLDNDGKPDVLSASYGDNKIAWYKNNGNGTIDTTQKVISPYINGAHSVYAADLDNDGDNDVISASLADGYVFWHKNNGDGTFAARTIIANFPGAANVMAADFDNDGDIDVVANSSTSKKVVWFSNNLGSFSGEKLISSTMGSTFGDSMTLGDIDNDGDTDIAIADGINTVAWYKNNNGASFTLAKNITTTASSPRTVNSSDFDNDGDKDIIVGSYTDNTITLYENTGADISTTKKSINTNAVNVVALHTNDLDKDGDIDILSVNYGAHSIALLENKKSKANININAPKSIINSHINAPYSVYSADLDNDGDMDIVSGSANDNKVAWYANNGNNTFSAQKIITTNAINLRDVYIADLDNDGKPDVLSASYGDNKIAWYKNNGNGTIDTTQKVISPYINGAHSVYAADLDNDGDNDVISASLADGYVFWHKNNGDGTFAARTIIANFPGAANVMAADFDNDGDIDVVANSSTSKKVVWFSNNLGSFSGEKLISSTMGSTFGDSMTLGDIDNDGDTDIAIADGINTVAWYKNNNGASFTLAKNITTTASSPRTVNSSDFDNDGDKDIIVGSYTDNTITLYENTGADISTTKKSINTNAVNVVALHTNDLDKDGDIDILSVNYGAHSIALLENTRKTSTPSGTPLKDLDSIKNLSIATKVLSFLPIIINSPKEESFARDDGGTQLVISGDISFKIPLGVNGDSIAINGGELLVLAKTDEGKDNPSSDAIFIKYSIRDFLQKGTPDRVIPDSELNKVPNVEMIIAYSSSELDKEAINTMPQTVQDYFSGILSPKFGIPIFNTEGSINVFFPIGLDNLPSAITKPLDKMGVNNKFITQDLGLSGKIVASLSVGNIAFVMDLLSHAFPEVSTRGAGAATGVKMDLGVVFPALKLPEFFTTNPALAVLDFKPDTAAQIRTYTTVSADIVGGLTALVGAEVALRMKMPNILNAEKLKNSPEPTPIDVRASFHSKMNLSLKLKATAGVEGTIRLVNEWKNPLGITGISVADAILNLGIAFKADAKVVGVGMHLDVGWGGQFSCLDKNNNPIGTPKKGAAYVGLDVLYQPPTQAIIKPTGIGMYTTFPNLTLEQSLRCAVGVQLSAILGGSDSAIAAMKEPELKEKMRTFINNASGDIESFVDNVISKPLEFAPIEAIMSNIRLNNGSFYFAFPGPIRVSDYLVSIGLNLSGDIEHRKDKNSPWLKASELDFSATLSGISSRFKLGDVDLPPALTIKDSYSSLDLILAPPKADMVVSGKTEFLGVNSSISATISAATGTKINIESDILEVAKSNFSLYSFDTGEKFLGIPIIDYKGNSNFIYNPTNAINAVNQAVNILTESNKKTYSKWLKDLKSSKSKEEKLKKEIAKGEAKVEKDQERINKYLWPAYNGAKYNLAVHKSRMAGHYDKNQYHAREAKKGGLPYWWHKGWQAFHWGAYRAYKWEGVITVAGHKIKISSLNTMQYIFDKAKNAYDTVTKEVRKAIDVDLNKKRLELTALTKTRELGETTVRELNKFNTFIADINNSAKDVLNIKINKFSGSISSLSKYDDVKEPMAVVLEIEIPHYKVVCGNQFNIYKGDIVKLIGGVDSAISDCINKVAKQVKSDIKKIVKNSSQGLKTNTAIQYALSSINNIPKNDNISNAISLDNEVVVSASNVGATLEDGEFADIIQEASVWWKWKTNSSGIYQITISGEKDTAIHIHSSNDVSKDSLLVTDIRPTSPGKITYYFDANTTYYIATTSQFSRPSNFNLSIQKLSAISIPANDNFSNAKEISGVIGFDSSHNHSATIQENEKPQDGLGNYNSQWWKFVAPETGVYTFDSYGSEFDTVMRIYSYKDSNINNATLLKTSDDFASDSRANSSIRLTKGQGVKISIASKNKSLGRVELRWTYKNLPKEKWQGDDFVNAIKLASDKNNVSISNIGATTEKSEMLHDDISNYASIWFEFTPNVSGNYIFNTKSSDFDTIIALYSGSSIKNLTKLASNNDFIDSSSRITHNLDAGVKYYVAVAGNNYEEGVVGLSYLLNAINDKFDDSLTLSGKGGVFEVDLSDASLNSIDEPYYEAILADQESIDVFSYFGLDSLSNDELYNNNGVDSASSLDKFLEGKDYSKQNLEDLAYELSAEYFDELESNKINRSLWWKFTPTEDGKLTIDSLQTSLDTAIFIFSNGESIAELNDNQLELAWSDNASGTLASELSLDVVANTTYHIAITGRTPGKAKINWKLVDKASQKVANDLSSSATLVVSDLSMIPTGSFSANNTYARVKNNLDSEKVKQLFPLQSKKRLWWKFKPTTKGFVTFDTQGSKADTVIEVYEVNTNNNYTLITSNDDFMQNSKASRVRFAIKKSANYLIAVDTIKGSGNEIKLNYKFENTVSNILYNDEFSKAKLLSGNSVNLVVDNNFSQHQVNEPDIGSIKKPNAIWYKWQAPQSGKLIISANSTMTNTVLGVYRGDKLKTLANIGVSDSGYGGNNNSVTMIVQKDFVYYIALATKYSKQSNDIALRLNLNAISTIKADNETIATAKQWDNNNSSITFALTHNTIANVTGSDLVKGSGNQATSRWYKWIAPENGEYVFDNRGSEIIVDIEIYQGNDMSSIVLQDVGGVNSDGNIQVKINAKQNQEFYIRSTSSFDSQGKVVLNYSKNGEYVTQSKTVVISDSNYVGAAKISESGLYSWVWTAPNDGYAMAGISTLNKVDNMNLYIYSINDENQEKTLVKDTSKDEQKNPLFKLFEVKQNHKYQAELNTGVGIYGDTMFNIGYMVGDISKAKPKFQESDLEESIQKIKNLVSPLLDNRIANDIDSWLIEDEVVLILETLFPAELKGNIYFDLEIAERDQDLVFDGIAKIEKTRLLAYDIKTEDVLLAINFDPKSDSNQNKEKHSKVLINGEIHNLLFETESSNTAVSKVGIQLSDNSFNDNIGQAFVSVGSEDISNYKNKIITPKFQNEELYDFDLNVFTENNKRYDFSKDGGKSIINKIKIRLPINAQSLRDWLGVSNKTTAQENELIRKAFADGRLKIISASSVKELIGGKVKDLDFSKDSVVNMQEGYVDFFTNHFSSFAIVDSSVNAEPDKSRSSGGCVLNNSSNNSFDPLFYLLFIIALLRIKVFNIYKKYCY